MIKDGLVNFLVIFLYNFLFWNEYYYLFGFDGGFLICVI